MPRSVLPMLYCSFKPRTAMSGRNSSPFLHEKKLRHREGETLVSGYTTTSGHQHSNRQTGSGTQLLIVPPYHQLTLTRIHTYVCASLILSKRLNWNSTFSSATSLSLAGASQTSSKTLLHQLPVSSLPPLLVPAQSGLCPRHSVKRALM